MSPLKAVRLETRLADRWQAYIVQREIVNYFGLHIGLANCWINILCPNLVWSLLFTNRKIAYNLN